ncbi:hypothetical protein [Photobacterium iliopiscarium]|uniref:hypothetical protein n=1 Tax=Photobacterium iliopiscarium TaxID=56192 RepID=UPI001E6250CC|nr:hypothetical protein [Photobacterium iliopiscarium]MCD9489163.1 hypothetical protein [Photobacterium iliopiscarium]MCF2245837.1 hypothetical protein [Photobacterium iliopiscarium]
MIKSYIARKLFPELSVREFQTLYFVFYIQVDKLRISKGTFKKRLLSCAEKLQCDKKDIREVFLKRIRTLNHD